MLATWVSTVRYGVGVGGWATVHYFGTDPRALDPGAAARLIDHVNDDTARMLVVPIGGALLVALGSMALSVALWCARSVPRCVPVLGIVTAVTGFVVPPDTIAGIVAEAASSATAVAVGWYAWRRPVQTDDARHGTTTHVTDPAVQAVVTCWSSRH